MSFGSVAVIICAATVAIGLAATHPPELRKNRWWRIGLSLPWVVLIAATFVQLEAFKGFMAMWGFAVLGFIWMGPMSHAGSFILQRLIYGDLNAPTGVRADFNGARSFRKHGEFEEAIECTLTELQKEPGHYEGLLLLTGLYHDTDQPAKAMQTVEALLAKEDLTHEQKAFVCQLEKELAELNLVTIANSR